MTLKVLSILSLCSVAVVGHAATATITVPPNRTYLHCHQDSGGDNPFRIRLSDYGFQPGDVIYLHVTGSYNNHGGAGDDYTRMIGAWDNSGSALGSSATQRITPLPSGRPQFTTVNTWTPRPNGESTNIANDFEILTGWYTIPAGATHLWLTGNDSHFQDNVQNNPSWKLTISHDRAPIIEPNPTEIVVNEGDIAAWPMHAYDPDPFSFNPLWSLFSGPGQLTTSGMYIFPTGENDGGNVYPIGIRVANASAPSLVSDVRWFNVRVIETNVAPVWAGLLQANVEEHLPFTQNLASSVSDGDAPAQTLSFAAGTGTPPWVSVSPAGVVSGIPPETAGGSSVTFTVTVSDGILTVPNWVTLNVAETNTPTVWANVPPQDTEEYKPFSINLAPYAFDTDNPAQPLTFAAGTGTPSWVSITPAGMVTGTPPETAGGSSVTFAVTVSDGISTVPNWVTLNVAEKIGTLSGQVELRGWNGTGPVEAMAHVLLNGNTVQSLPILINPNGAINFALHSEIGPGSYQVKIKPIHWLSATVAASLSTEGVAGLSFTCQNGDADGDDEIGPGDLQIVLDSFQASPGEPNWNPLADLDGDGEVGPGDLQIVLDGF